MKKIIAASFLFPVLAFAQTSDLHDLLLRFGDIVELAVPLAASFVALFFFWGLAKYLFKGGDEGARQEGRRIMFWGVIALFAMTSIWGVVALFQNAFGIEGEGQIHYREDYK